VHISLQINYNSSDFLHSCSLAINHSIHGCIKYSQPLHQPLLLFGMADGSDATGIEVIDRIFPLCDHKEVHILTDGYNVPQENVKATQS